MHPVVQADLRSEHVVDVLSPRSTLGDRAALFPCTDLTVAADLAEPGAAWRRGTTSPCPTTPSSRCSWTRSASCRARAGSRGLPIPRHRDPRRPGRRRARSPDPGLSRWSQAAAEDRRSGSPTPAPRHSGRRRPRTARGLRPGRAVVRPAHRPGVGRRRRGRPVLVQRVLRPVRARPLVTFVARKLRQWPPHTGTSAPARSAATTTVLERRCGSFGASTTTVSPTWR